MAVPLLLLGACTAAYLVFAIRQRMARGGWSGWRIASFVAGAAVLALGLLPRYLPFPAGDFRQHMLEHLAIGMLAPIGLVMAAPVTLLLRTVPTTWGRVFGRVLNSPLLRVITNPFTALVLDMGGMAVLYFTPLYQAMMAYPTLHYAVHAHFLAAGCLYSWVIAGPDPAPHRPSVPARLVVLGIAIVIHSVLSQLLYAGVGVRVFAASMRPQPATELLRSVDESTKAEPSHALQLQRGAELMYYGGDISEMLLAFGLVTTWHPGRRRGAAAIPDFGHPWTRLRFA